MNRRNRIFTVLCLVLMLAMIPSVFAESSLLTPGTSRIAAGSSFDFTLNLESLNDGEQSEPEEVLSEYVVSLEVSPQLSMMSVKEGVGTLNPVTGVYQVSSSQLGSIDVLHFTIGTDMNLQKEATYTVSVNVTGSKQASDSFEFIVTTNGQQQVNPEQDIDISGKKMGFTGKKDSVSAGAYSGTTVTYAGSWDNYLDELSVSGYEFTREFNKTRDTYFLTVPNDVTDISVSATASDSSAVVAIAGYDDLVVGRNKVMVNVTADDGSVRVYRIYVTRLDKGESVEETEDVDE